MLYILEASVTKQIFIITGYLSTHLHLFSLSIIFLSIWTYGYLFLALDYNIIIFSLLVLKLLKLWFIGLSFSLLPYPFDSPHPFVSWNERLFQSYFAYSYLISRISNFSKFIWFGKWH